MNKLLAFCLAIVFLAVGASSSALSEERQLTFDGDANHQLDNNLNFSPDSKWLAYDTRAFDGGIRNTTTLVKVNIDTAEKVIIHETANSVVGFGPGVAAVSYFPAEDKVISIHGLPNLKYEGFRRFGSIFSPTDGTAGIVVADARDTTLPFTPGALRGGSHRHEPSGDGQWIGFTYNDMIMAGQGKDLRTVGVTKLGMPVTVDHDAAGENQDGIGFTVLVVKVVSEAEVAPDTDQIFQASDDAWVGDHGYQKPDGSMQRARAFIGRTKRTTPSGAVVTRNEVFVVDIPEDITVPGPDGPLEGTATTFPMPPAGTVQRMLTHSASDAGSILRASKDGSWIAYSQADDKGVSQIFLVSPLGGNPVQATFHDTSTQKPWWHPSNDYIVSVSAGAIYATNVDFGDSNFGKSWRLTDPTPDAPPDALAVSPDGKWVAFNRSLPAGRPDSRNVNQIFVTSFVPEPASFQLAAFGMLISLAHNVARRPASRAK